MFSAIHNLLFGHVAKANFAKTLKPDLVQAQVNERYIRSKLRDEYTRVKNEKTLTLNPPHFTVGEVVRVVCSSENFRYGWESLGHPFEIGNDQIGEVTKVFVNGSMLEELLVEDYSRRSFQVSWRNKYDRELGIADLNTKEFVNEVNNFVAGIDLYYSYNIKFDDPKVMNVQWDFPEKFIAYPIGIQTA